MPSRTLRVGRPAARRRTEAWTQSRHSASSPRTSRRTPPHPRDREAPARAAIPPHGPARACARAQLPRRSRAHGLPSGSLRTPNHARALRRRGDGFRRSRPRHDGGRRARRTRGESDIRLPWAGARRAISPPHPANAARRTERARLRPAERAPTRASDRARIAHRSGFFRPMVRWMAVAAYRLRSRSRGRARERAADVAPANGLAAAWPHRSG